IEPTIPPVPVWAKIDEAREVVGLGSIFLDENDEPRIHLHSALGHHGQTTTACIRKGTKTYLLLEAYLTEILEINITRPWFADGQFYRICFS
ncbi:MAG: DNA-binding protein, partial [Desulfobulbaceae bacterium]|nr:DNA-binding protein [Desulfobulbaceae bacterium]